MASLWTRMAAPHSDLIRQAVLLARDGQPEQALALLLEKPVAPDSPDAPLYHYTVGSLLARTGKAGEAFAHLDFARVHQSTDPTVRNAWNAARKTLEQRLGPEGLDSASTPLERWADGPLSAPLQALVAVLALATWLNGRRRARYRLALAATVLAVGVSSAQWFGSRHPAARAAASASLRAGPGEDFPPLLPVEPGVLLRILRRQSGWLQVRVAPQSSGWVPEASVLLLKPPSTKRD